MGFEPMDNRVAADCVSHFATLPWGYKYKNERISTTTYFIYHHNNRDNYGIFKYCLSFEDKREDNKRRVLFTLKLQAHRPNRAYWNTSFACNAFFFAKAV